MSLIFSSPSPATFTYGISQDDLNYMARNLEVKYTVKDNLNPPMTLTVNLKNTGNQDITAKDWSLYFSHIRVLQPGDLISDGFKYITRDGAMLGQSGLKLYHVNGILFRIDATPDFVTIPMGEAIDLNIHAQHWEVCIDLTFYINIIIKINNALYMIIYVDRNLCTYSILIGHLLSICSILRTV